MFPLAVMDKVKEILKQWNLEKVIESFVGKLLFTINKYKEYRRMNSLEWQVSTIYVPIVSIADKIFEFKYSLFWTRGSIQFNWI